MFLWIQILKLEDIEIKGITEVKLEDIKKAKVENKKLKLIGKVEKNR